MHRKGITAFEIVVLVFIIVVLVAFLVPFNVRTNCGSRKTSCKNSLKQLGIYFALYESKYKAYPPPGADTWFALLWRKDMATDGNLFRCAVRGKSGAGTHYWGLKESGTWGHPGSPPYSWGSAGLDDKLTPPDFPIAADGNDERGVPNHGPGDDRNILFFQGRVDVFAIGAPTEVDDMKALCPSSWAAPAGTK